MHGTIVQMHFPLSELLSGMESGTPKSMSNVVEVMALKLAIYVDAPTVGKGFRYA